MQRDKLLMTPGPTNIPYKVREAMSRPMIHHRTEEFGFYFNQMNKGLKMVFQTENPVLTLASSGTGAMEASITNVFSPGDKVLIANGGVFGDRLVKIADRFGLDVVTMDIPWGQEVTGDDIEAILSSEKGEGIKGVLITHNETSTGVTNDIESIGNLLKDRDCLLIVDAISSLGGIDLQTDNWGVDIVIAGSQKAFMLPPGLAFVSVSQRAWAAVEKSTFPKFYFDFSAYRESLEKNTTPYTPAATLIIGASESLKMIKEQGLENIFARHENLAKACRAAVKALGLELFASENAASNLITSIKSPNEIDIERVRSILNLDYDIMVAGGQQHLKGKILRIGHMGYVDGFDLIKTLSALERALIKTGYDIELGTAVSAAQAVLEY
ncbi:MAG: alanine--glyoxylate aminotransferase family protein [Clostridiales bacterium]|nr:alanine--glyoxylate aminotransferase family protein [Clostridiales bacterium]